MFTQAGHDLDAFIAALRDKDFFDRAGRGFALLTPGDWTGLRRWAQSLGFTFTLPELYAYCAANPAVLAQLAQAPRLAGWTLESLRQAARA